MLEFIFSVFSVEEVMWLIIAIPLLCFAVNGIISIVSSQYSLDEPRPFVVASSVLASVLSFFLVVLTWFVLYELDEPSPAITTSPLIKWMGFFGEPLEFGLKADSFSITILFALSFVGMIIHLYSVGYLSREKRVAGYFSLSSLVLSLTFLLVLTDSFFLFFVVWQVISIAGVIFISRHFKDTSAIRAASAYYVSEVISGSALLLVMVLIWKVYLVAPTHGLDIFNFDSMDTGVNLLQPYATIICFALFIGILARSMQFPFYVWIPDASTAKIPIFAYLFGVSSVLIPLYLMIRLQILFYLSPRVLVLMTVLGCAGALFGPLAAMVQKDLKKIAAYLVISGASLALVGFSVKAFETVIFHVFTYAFYTISLILGIGSVIAATGEDSINNLSGLRKLLPITFCTTTVGALAASGIYPFSGFFAKNGIIWEVYRRGETAAFIVVFISSIIYAIAVFRMIAAVFFGRFSRSKWGAGRYIEFSVSMLVSMVVAAFVAVVSGWVGVSQAFGGKNHFMEWLRPFLITGNYEKRVFSELVLAVVVTIFVAHAAFVTSIVYVHKRRWPEMLSERYPRTHRLLVGGFYIDRIYEAVILKPLYYLSEWVLYRGVDKMIIDGVIVGGIGRVIDLLGEIAGRLRVSSYQTYVLLAIAALVAALAFVVF